ncbi:MAG: hypothetical protein RLY97_468 [Pseudomonadota bacterium]
MASLPQMNNLFDVDFAAPIAGKFGHRAGTTLQVELAQTRSLSLVDAKLRVKWVLWGFGIISLAAFAKISYFGMAGSAPSDFSLSAALLPDRGDITDRNGVPLARAFPAYSLWYNPKALGEGSPLVKSPAEVAAALTAIFPDMAVADLQRRLASGKAGFLRNRILPDDANRIHALGEPALEFPRTTERYYPQGAMAAHILGQVGVDSKGRLSHGTFGMEQVFDAQLTNQATRGAPSVLSIDMRVQGALEDELMRGMLASGAKGAAGIVLDVDTGEVLSLASLPSFNPNRIDTAGAQNIFNLASNQVYELGSVFKSITVAAGIEYGTITDYARRYPAGLEREVGGHLVHDHKNYGETLNVPETLVYSSNIVAAQLGENLGWVRLKSTLQALGMDQRPAIELPAKGQSLWPAERKWSPVTTTTVAYGHGLSVTPLHMASAYAALVNGGIWRPATLRKLDAGQAPVGRRIWKASTSARMRQLLRMIVQLGTGRTANAAGFRVGGKTGTAEKYIDGVRFKDRVVTTFASAFPMDHPRYVVLITLDEPKANAATSFQRTAAYNAAPIVGKLVPRIGPMLGIYPDMSRDINISDLAPLVPNGAGE